MRRTILTMKKIILLTILAYSNLFSQFNYPAEDFLGGGIGYSPMYIKLNGIPGESSLKNFGLDTTQFNDPFVIHGGGNVKPALPDPTFYLPIWAL